MHLGDTALAHVVETPVLGGARQRGGRRTEEADPDEDAGGVAVTRYRVEDQRTRPGADRDGGEGRMNRVADRFTREQASDRSLPYRVPNDGCQGVGGAVEKRERFGGAQDAVSVHAGGVPESGGFDTSKRHRDASSRGRRDTARSF